MKDKKEIRQKIINHLCGSGDELSDEFLNLLHTYDMGEAEGLLIKNELSKYVDSANDLDLIFNSKFMDYYKISIGLEDDLDIKLLKQYDDEIFKENLTGLYVKKDISYTELRKYCKDEDYLSIVEKQYPQSISEAVDTAVDILDAENIISIKKQEKSTFGNYVHFGLGLFMRNNFGINGGKARGLLEDFRNNFKWRFYQSDDVSGYLCDRIWDEIQENFDEIMKTKEDAQPVRELERECRDYYNDCEYEEAIKVSDEILKSNPQNHHALTYKILSHYYLKDYEKALNAADDVLETYHDYSRFLNLKAHILYLMGDEKGAMECLDTTSLNIGLLNKKLYLLLSMDKLDEAYELYQSLSDEILFDGFKIQVLVRKLAVNGKHDQAIECYNHIIRKLVKPYTHMLEFDFIDIQIIDWIKEDFRDYGLDLNKIHYNELYMSWIYKFTYEKPTKSCPICGAKLAPIVYTELNMHNISKFKGDEILRENVLDEFNPYTHMNEYYCRNCKKEYNMGINGVNMECSDNYLEEKYALEKIHDLGFSFYENRASKEDIKHYLFSLDDNELDALIEKLIGIGYLVEVEEDVYEYANVDN